MSYWGNCPSCKRQIKIDGNAGEHCYFCGAELKKKVVNHMDLINNSVPIKPDITGLNKGQITGLMRRYYNENKAAIIADFEKYGEKKTIKKWGISNSGWRTLRARFMPDRFKMPDWYSKKGKKKQVQKKDIKTNDNHKDEPSEISVEATTEGTTLKEQLAELRGWQMAIREVLSLKGKND